MKCVSTDSGKVYPASLRSSGQLYQQSELALLHKLPVGVHHLKKILHAAE